MRPVRVGELLGRVIFAGRWLLVPVYLGLLAAIALVVAKSVLTLAAAVPALPGMAAGDVLLLSLKLIDLALVGGLLLMVALGGWESFVTPVLPGDPGRPDWLGHLDFAALKAKVIGAVAAIAAIDLLETVLNAGVIAATEVLWRVVALLAFAGAGVLLALADRLGR